jgi:two-component system, LytTR family, response regulator
MTIRALIIDDELPARDKIRRFLTDEPLIVFCGEADNGADAIRLIEAEKPDLLFLDIQLSNMTGFDILEATRNTHQPQIIFTTAYDQYAIKAFEVRAIDYLLKPFDQPRFKEALSRVMRNIEQHQDQKIEDLLDEFRKKQKHLQRILIRAEGKIYFIKTDDIRWIEAEEKYVWLHTAKESHLHRATMNSLESQLDPAKFIRIHRSQIVNMEFILEIQPWAHGDYVILLKDGKQLPLGRSYKDKFMEVFEKGI